MTVPKEFFEQAKLIKTGDDGMFMMSDSGHKLLLDTSDNERRDLTL